ncbi:MAG: hypothetical protein RSE41_08565, partial [Clostridia bacterium]
MAIQNKLASFAFVGIKNLLVYSRETGALLADIDKMINIALNDNLQVDYLRAGYGNPKIMTIFGDRETQLTGTVGTMSAELLEVMTGSTTEVKTKAVDDVVVKQVVSNKITLAQTPNTSATIAVFKLDQYGKAIKPALEKVSGTPSDNQFSVTGKDLTFKTGAVGSYKIVYKYDVELETIEAKDIKPKSYKMVGICVAREIESGKLYK